MPIRHDSDRQRIQGAMQMRRRVMTVSTVGLIAMGMVAACGSSSKPKVAGTTGTTASGGTAKYPPIPAGPIVLGASVPLSGPTASYGTVYKQALETVTLKTFNAAHPDGIDGHPVDIKIL